MTIRPACRILTGLVLMAAVSNAADTLIVLNKSDHEAALVNPDTYEVFARMPTGKGPHEAAVSRDGRTAYVTNYGSYAIFREGQRQQMPPGNTITVLDLASRSVKATFELGDYLSPHGIRTSRDGSRLWVTSERTQSVLELDAANGKVLRVWKTEQVTSHMVVPTPDERKLYVSNIGSGSVTVINRMTDSVATIPTSPGTEGIDMAPDGREVWVTNRLADSISVIDVATDRELVNFASAGQFPIRVKFTPDGRQAWVSNLRSNSVAVFDARTRQLVGSLEVGAAPVGIQMTPDGKRAFVANTNANQVTVIDVAARKVIKTFTTGQEPDGMAWAVEAQAR